MNDKNDNQQRQPRQGVFDQKNSNLKAPIEPVPKPAVRQEQNNAPSSEPKEDFKDPFEQQGTDIKERARKAKENTDTYADETASKINKSLSDGDISLEELPITEDDIKLAEKLIFDGYAETEVFMDSFPNNKFTICSTNAEEIGMIDEIIYDVMKKHETNDGMIDIPQNKVQALRNAIFACLGYRGRDGEDLCGVDRSRNLVVIKKAIVRRGDLEQTGKSEEVETLNKSLKEAIVIRARRIQQLPTPMIDFITAEKYKFDKKMYKIMTMKGVVPKS